MGKKQKSIKKVKNQQKSKLLQETPEELLARTQRALSSGKARDAIELAKIAAKKSDISEETIQHLLFRAYLLREEQLRNKGMSAEADAVNRQALASVSDAGKLDESDLALFAASAATDKAFDAYAAYLFHRPPSLTVERQLVNRLLRTEQWHLLEKIDPQTPLRKDAQAIPAAVQHMNNGLWETALEQLRHIPRSSPFAPLRLLCRAMEAFYAEDDQGFAKALSMVPGDFFLHPVISALHQYIAAGPGNYGTTASSSGSDPGPGSKRNRRRLHDPDNTAPAHPYNALQIFFDGPVDNCFEMKQVLSDLRRGNRESATRRINRLAHAIYPEDPDACRKIIIELLNNETLGAIQKFEYVGLVRSMMDAPESSGLMLRIDMLGERPLDAAARYIELLPRFFSNRRRRAIAKSLVLLRALKTSRENKSLCNEFSPYYLEIDEDMEMGEAPWHLLGIDRTIDADLYLQIASEGIACDPENRQWYELITELPRLSRQDKAIAEEALQAMAAHFPEDPFPFIELAGLYGAKKAHRKAEKAIEQAAALAPYDNRVIDRKAVLYLTSAQINFERGKLSLARTDLEKAASLESRPTTPFVTEKRLLLDLAETPASAEAILSNAFSGMEPFERLYLLVLLMWNIQPGTAPKHKGQQDLNRLAEKVRTRIDMELSAIAPSLSSRQIMQLLSPVPREYAPVIPAVNYKALRTSFSEEQITMLLRQVDDADIISACNQLVPTKRHDIIKEELSSRLEAQGDEKHPVMKFYYLVIDDISGKITNTVKIIDLLDESTPENISRMQDIAARLAPFANGRLGEALYLFNFHILDPDPWMEDDLFDDFFDPDFDIADDRFREPQALLDGDIGKMSMEQIVEGIEDLVNVMDCRGLPNKELRIAKKIAEEHVPQVKRFSRELPPKSKEEVVRKISREARILFFD